MSIANAEDVDPISLEPVSSLACYFDYKHNRKIYRYDAWAWLEMMVHEKTDEYTHPIFRCLIPIQDRQNCFEACRDMPNKSAMQQELIDTCLSESVHKLKDYDLDGRLCRIHIFTVSPLFRMQILEWWWKWAEKPNPKPDFAKAFNCQVAMDVSILDYTGKEALHRQYFV